MADKIGNVWVFIEQEGGKIADVSLELVSKGKELAERLGVKTEAVLLGNNVESCCSTLFEYGCDTVYLAEDPRLEPFTVLPFAKVIMDLIRAYNPNILLFGATMKGRELAPRVASEKLAGLTADCTDLKIEDFDDKVNGKYYTDKLMQIRPAFGGNIIATIVNTWDDPQMVTVREGVMKMGTPEPGRTGEIIKVDVALTAEETVVKVIERIREEKSVDLKGARIIVAGGYGVGSKENFKLIHDLAKTLGGEVGASRAAVDAGWISLKFSLLPTP
ncbi:MAG: electron transfer flavoprotein subunit alpha/FixB family protein [Lentisphaeria bacterium]|nr:electron transfer flavoprotein subunit alpha/FixB family protein [Lentisphaeria bacterium]